MIAGAFTLDRVGERSLANWCSALMVMAAIDLYPGFPSVALTSQADFAASRKAAQDRLDARHAVEQAEISSGEPLVRPGTCALCLSPTRFATDPTRWERLPDGRRLPQWEEAQICDCADRLGKRARAVVHFAQAAASLRSWTRLLLFGPPDPSHRRLAACAGTTATCAALRFHEDGRRYRLPVAPGAFHLIVAVECLHHVPPLDAALAAFRIALAPGGSLVFTVPFRHDTARTVSRTDLARPDGRLPPAFRDPVHEIGWDVLDRLSAAGFATAAAHSYWSAELGYLGSHGMIFHAAC
jgi:SAM-dependent methyltransferase